MIDLTPQTLLSVAEEAATIAADFLAGKHKAIFQDKTETLDIQTKSSERDLVTQLDRQVQAMIIEHIQLRFPDHRFIAEEEGADTLGNPSSPFAWIIDPLDGTTNFVHGKPNFGTIIAVQQEEELQAGVMMLPLLHRKYTAAKGQGAFANGTRITLRNTKNMQDAVLCSNIVWRAQRDPQGTLWVTVPDCGSVENYGCAAHEFGDILEGWNDGIFFRGIKLWDIAAGCLMMQEAGGNVRYERAGDGTYLLAASTPQIFDELEEFVFAKKLA